MKPNVQLLEEMVDIAVALNPDDKTVVIKDDGESVTVTRVVKKLKTVDFTLAQLREVHRNKCEQHPEFNIELNYTGREEEQ